MVSLGSSHVVSHDHPTLSGLGSYGYCGVWYSIANHMKESLRSVISLLYLGHYVYSNSQIEAGIGEARISPLYFESVQYNTSKVPTFTGPYSR